MNQPKRILSLDGGGIRGALTLGFLERIEKILRERTQNPNLKLCEYFDLIGGTSTGAIIAGGLSIGMSATEIKDLYLDLGDKIFGKRRSWLLSPLKRYRAEFDFRPLEKALKEVFGNITLGSDQIKTGLCIVTKRADTLSTWPILNHPQAKFYEHNKNMLLRKVIRASAAAPTYFIPQQIEVAKGEIGTFIDGGVSLANNPSLQLFLVATLSEFPYRWPTGEDKLSIVSLGTGAGTKYYNPDKVLKKGLAGWGKMVPELFMEDANYMNQTLLQYLSHSPTPRMIDSEILDLKNDLIGDQPALHYVRYNVMLDDNELQNLGFALNRKQLKSLGEMSAAQNKEILYEIGAKAATQEIISDHLI